MNDFRDRLVFCSRHGDVCALAWRCLSLRKDAQRKTFYSFFFSLSSLTWRLLLLMLKIPSWCVCAPKIPCRLFNNSVETRISLEPDMDLNLLYKLDENLTFSMKTFQDYFFWPLRKWAEFILVGFFWWLILRWAWDSYPFFYQRKHKWNQSSSTWMARFLCLGHFFYSVS